VASCSRVAYGSLSYASGLLSFRCHQSCGEFCPMHDTTFHIADMILWQDGSGFTAYNFFQYLIGLLVIVVFTLVYKVVFRTPFRDPRTADLRTGRNKFSAEDLAQLDAYYAMSRYRRFLTYVQLW
jgi:amino acid permease